MKRCPQCEFVYEDDQSLCDMDGILLVFDPHQLPKPTNAGSKSKRPQWRARVVPALAALVLSTVLYLVYYVSTNQQPARPTYSPASPTATNSVSTAPDKTTIPIVTAAPEETKVSSPPPAAKENKEEKAKANTAPAAKVVTESKEKPKLKPKAQSSTSSNEEESKIGSLLKKTGRILKKPFKL